MTDATAPALLGMSPRQFRTAVIRQRVPYMKLGQRTVVFFADLQTLAHENASLSEAHPEPRDRHNRRLAADTEVDDFMASIEHLDERDGVSAILGRLGKTMTDEAYRDFYTDEARRRRERFRASIMGKHAVESGPGADDDARPMPKKTFKLVATVSSDAPAAVGAPLKTLLGPKAKIEPTDDGFRIEATLTGESAKDLNRQLLSELRRAEKKTRLRAEWTSAGVTEKFFDYVPKGTKKVPT